MKEYILSEEVDVFYLFSKTYFEKKNIIDNQIFTKENIQQICNTNDDNKRHEILNKYIDINTYVDENKKKVELFNNIYYGLHKKIIECITVFNNCDYEPDDIEDVKIIAQQKALNPVGDNIEIIKNLLNSFTRKPKEFKNTWTRNLIENKFTDIFEFIKKTKISLDVNNNTNLLFYSQITEIKNLLSSVFDKIYSEEELRAAGKVETRSYDERENDLFNIIIEKIKKNDIFIKSNSDITYQIYIQVQKKYEETVKENNKKKMIKYGIIILAVIIILSCCSSLIYYVKSRNKNTLSSSSRRRKRKN